MIQSMHRLVLFEGEKIVETTVRFSIKRMIQAMHRLAIIEGQKIVETTVRISS